MALMRIDAVTPHTAHAHDARALRPQREWGVVATSIRLEQLH
ncbi:hypothetical protein P4N68_08230 [Corynebacterium felinum]|uniref:Uncharacterized protein n=1 Tax=Corynebacterium felinum TaxID=131318 RepID=A0ABU2BAC2_9CORY|nr:hypothetical protein [Corynebacterium felinum]MDF5821065.1 hypothetical protein [Corynebacterium felinum]MDR7354929.1 hypothetical protein [Corynebacterium felinum]